MSAFSKCLGGLMVSAAMQAALESACPAQRPAPRPGAAPSLKNIGVERGLCVVLGLPQGAGAGDVVDLARGGHLVIYFQSPQPAQVAAVRVAAARAGLLGTRVFADQGEPGKIQLGDNLADAIVVGDSLEAAEAELLRVLHPGGAARIGRRRIVKPDPAGTDSWSHVYHGPDNNPLSRDQLARAPYLTQFLGEPKFVPMPEVSVAAGGRVFRAFGHIAHKANQNAMLNTLVCVNGYNGAILWTRPLREGFMIHRNTMVATPDRLLVADDASCKLLDARTGRLEGEIRIPEGAAGGPVWKWMALEDGTLYALVGAREVRPRTVRSDVPGMGHWPWGMWEGHDYKDPSTNFGFGRTFVAVELATGKILWSHREEDYVDARGVCMRGGRIYFYSPGRFLGCLEADSGRVGWKNADAKLLEAIGPPGQAQRPVTGYATTTFIKCNDRYVFLAGPQRERLVVASTEDGRLVWHKEPGNLQLVLRDEAIYAAGPQRANGFKLAYDTGAELALLPGRRACTRATGSVDSIFFRATGGTVRIDVAGDKPRHIAPMRPPCQDGVIISDGLLYWGPWMCGCQLSLYGHIALGPAGGFDFHPKPDGSRLTTAEGAGGPVQPFKVHAGDWTTYLGDNARTGTAKVAVPRRVARQWALRLPGATRPTAPIVAGGVVFVGDQSGAVCALDARDGAQRWQTCTGGPLFFPPALWQGRLYAGSADGRVYCLEAATGRVLWRFRAAPAEQRIPVYGKLISRWPVAGGVLVADGVVYAAAGIAHYDGTYVYALDALTGRVKWQNDSSGNLSEEVQCGISLQGELALVDGELRFAGGCKYETARYDCRSGACLNEPDNTVASQFRTAFYPYYPEYGRYVSLDRPMPGGRRLVYEASYEGSQHNGMALLEPLPPGATPQVKRAAPWPLPRRNPRRKAVWSDPSERRFSAFVVASDLLLAAGEAGQARSPFLAAIDPATGSDVWREDLPAAVVKAGAAVDHEGRIVVALESGLVLAYVGN